MTSEAAVDTSYQERNRQQRERLSALVRRLSDEELARPIGDGAWTVAATLAHLAYWDMRGLGALEAAVRHGLPLWFWDAADADAVNQAWTPKWRALPPREAAALAVQAAEAIDSVVEQLPETLIPTVARERYRILERALHRVEHLDAIEQALSERTT